MEDPRLVRGLDYYSRTLFEIKARGDHLGAQSAVCGGGRYDGLVKTLGGPDTPAIGFAMGLERLLLTTKAVMNAATLDAFVACQPGLETEGLHLCQRLRRNGLRVDCDLRGQAFKKQMKRAAKAGARFAVIVGEDELAAGVVGVKDLKTFEQTQVGFDALAASLTTPDTRR